MKLKIKVKTTNPKCLPVIIEKGDWVDLCTADKVVMKAPYAKMLHKKKVNEQGEEVTVDRYRDVIFDFQILPLGVAMELPEGFEAVVLPRSSLFKKTGLLLANSQGIIDFSYKSNTDIWGFPAVAIKAVSLEPGTRICQFRIQLSQKATVWQKLKWLFTSGIEIVEVDHLGNEARGGFGKGTGDGSLNTNTEDNAKENN